MKTFLTFVLCCLSLVSTIPLTNKEQASSDYVLVDFSDVVETRSRHRRETTDDEKPCNLKAELMLPIIYKNNTETLKLIKDEIRSPEKIPILELGPDGNLIVTTKTKADRGSALYYYEKYNHRFGIMVTCEFSALCVPTCQIRGDLITDEELIEIAGSVLDKAAEEKKYVPHNITIKQIPDTEFKSFGASEAKTPGMDRYGKPDPSAPPIRTVTRRRRKMRRLQRLKERLQKLLASTATARKRRKREASLWYQENEDIIELLMVNDAQLFNRFKFWDGKSYTDDEAILLMVEYMAYVASGIDLRMYNIRKNATDIRIRIHLSGIYATKNDDASKWASSVVYPKGELIPNLDADSAIGNLSLFVYEHSSIFSEFDHVMALTGQNIAQWIPSTNYWETGVLGYAFSGSSGVLCVQPYYSVSVVEAPAIGNPARIAAHEIAHTMRAGHDTKDGVPGCTLADQYIMAEAVYSAGSENRMHPFEFSQCSIESIRLHLNTLNNMAMDPDYSENIGSCLKHTQTGDVFSMLEDKRLMGDRYSYDAQCKFLMNDNMAHLCFEPSESYCYDYLYCYWPSVDPGKQFCFSGYAYNGSPCNGTDICFEGSCIPKSQVPLNSTEEMIQKETDST